MKIQRQRTNIGSAIICALCTVLIISLIGAGVLLNCTTRYNVSSKQVKGWKEALYAAEAGGDIALSEVRKVVTGSTAFLPSNGWTMTSGPSGPSYSNGYINAPYKFGQNNSLSAKVTVDKRTLPFGPPSLYYYRIRSQGTATLIGLPRVGMDDRMDHLTRGDSLLRKIDFRYDHFKARYGDGDGTPGTQEIQTVSNPQISRRIETTAVPQFLTFNGALRATGSFAGPGPAGVVDSYDSRNGAYTFVADNPSSPLYGDSRDGDVSAGTSSFTEWGPIYGDVTTNGGTITHKSNGTISGTIDNNVPFTIPPLEAPEGYPAGYNFGGSTTIATVSGTPKFYAFSSLTSSLTINNDPLAPTAETYVMIVVNGDVGGHITIGNHVNAQIYFTGNLTINTPLVVNSNVDGVAPNYSRAGHLQFYGISPTDGSTQTISVTPGGGSAKYLYATIYAPTADVTVNGNPDIYGAIVCHNYSGNGNTAFHYDKQLAAPFGAPRDYQIASYIEDVR